MFDKVYGAIFDIKEDEDNKGKTTISLSQKDDDAKRRQNNKSSSARSRNNSEGKKKNKTSAEDEDETNIEDVYEMVVQSEKRIKQIEGEIGKLDEIRAILRDIKRNNGSGEVA